MSRFPRVPWLRTAAVVLGAFVLTGAALGVGAPTSARAADDVAHVRVLHGGADAPAVDVLVDGKIAVNNISFGHATGYLALNSDRTYDVKVVPAANLKVVVYEIKAAHFDEGYYTVAAIGLLHPNTPAQAFTLKVYTDHNANIAGRARVRVVHAANAPAVDVYAARDDAAYAKVVSGATYPNATGYLAVKANEYRFAIAASPSTSVRQAIYYTPEVTLKPNSTYTAWAIGTVGHNFTVLLTVDSSIAPHADD